MAHDPDQTLTPEPILLDDSPICVMDAHCSLCARGARWVAHNDRRGEFRIVPLQSALGTALMARHALDPADPTSWLYLADGQAYKSLDALIQMGMRLGGFWKVFQLLRILPRPLRNGLYSVIARNRYRWFARANLCATPDPEVQKRLLQ